MTDAEYERLCRAMTAVVEENWRLRAALKPFTETARDVDERPIREARDDELVWVRVTYGQFRTAQAVITEQNGEDAQRSDK